MDIFSRLQISVFSMLALIACGEANTLPRTDASRVPVADGTTEAGAVNAPADAMGGSSISSDAEMDGMHTGGYPLDANPIRGDTTGDGNMADPTAGGTGGSSQAAGSGMSEDSGSSSGTAGTTSMACSSGGWTTGDQRITLTHDGLDRVYEVHVPPGYTGTAPVPLMLVIHGAHNTPRMARSWSQMDPVADENGFIIAYPAGIDCWNAGFTLPGFTAADDDVGFLMSVVADVSGHACIDPKRVYATGISNGSMMAQTLGCEKADVFAAVGGVAGPVGVSPCNPSRPITVTYFHGTDDQTVPFSSAEPTVNGWVQRNGCTGSPIETYNQGSTVCKTYQNCHDGVEVLFCVITGMGHCWPEDTTCIPQMGAGVDDFKASPMMWEFFERHPLP